MKRLTTNNASMKALRAHCLQIEPETSAVEVAHPAPEDSYNWFHLEPPTHAERYPTRPLMQHSRNEETVHNEWWTRNGKVDTAAAAATATAAKIAKQNKKVKLAGIPPTINELIEAELNNIRKKHYLRCRRRRQLQQEQEQKSKDIERLEAMKAVESRKKLNALVARGIAMDKARKQLVNGHKDYEQAYEENLKELEFGPGCRCMRFPWQHEVLPPKAMWGARWGAGKRVQWEGKAME